MNLLAKRPIQPDGMPWLEGRRAAQGCGAWFSHPTSLLSHPPAEPGASLSDVDTPALLLDLDAFERNLRRIHTALPSGRVRLRPHAKSHKCPEIARRQIAAGAVGVCCQKVSEAEAMANGGVRDIHITNEIVGARKLACLAELARHVDLSVCADNPSNVSELDAAASAAGTTLTVFVEVDVGNKRCGVSPGLAALALANQIVASPHLRFGGLQAYFGAAQHLRSAVERRSAATTAAEAARHTKSLLIASGIECPIVTGGGTGTWLLDAASETFDEIQPGSYVFMDADYARLELAEGSPGFEQSLFVWTTLMSHPSKEWGAVDAGLKALSTDSGMPPVHLRRGIEYTRAADEHGVLRFADPGGDLQVGEKLMLVPGHCDPTVNLHEWFVCFRKGKVEALWPITARGAFR